VPGFRFRASRAGQNIAFKAVLSVNLHHFRGLLVAGRLWISVLNHAYRELFFSQEQISQRVQVDSFSNLN
jgi:hypothetical protein